MKYLIQGTSKHSSNIQITTDANTGNGGSFVIVFAGSSDVSGTLSISDSTGATWTTVNALTSQSGAGKCQSWCATFDANTTTTITIADSAGGWQFICADEFAFLRSVLAVNSGVISGGGAHSGSVTWVDYHNVLWTAGMGDITGVAIGFNVAGDTHEKRYCTAFINTPVGGSYTASQEAVWGGPNPAIAFIALLD